MLTRSGEQAASFVRSLLARRTLAKDLPPSAWGFTSRNGVLVQQGASLLDPKTLSRIGPLQLRVRRVVEGVLTGLHRSPHRGQAVEFAEHKEYAPGDELRDLDWRVYARADKYYVKKYEVETNLRAWLVVDASASMGYGDDGMAKLDYAKVLAASLAWLLVRQQDMVGLVVAGAPSETPSAARSVFGGQDDAGDPRLPPSVRRLIPPRASPAQLAALIDVLERSPPSGATDLGGALDFVAEKAGRRALVVMLSDLFDPSPRALEALGRLRGRKCEVSVFHTLHRDELEFPFEDPTEFLSLEGEARVETSPHQIKEGYLAEMHSFLQSTRHALRKADVGYSLVQTDTPPAEVLLKFLAGRGR